MMNVISITSSEIIRLPVDLTNIKNEFGRLSGDELGIIVPEPNTTQTTL